MSCKTRFSRIQFGLAAVKLATVLLVIVAITGCEPYREFPLTEPLPEAPKGSGSVSGTISFSAPYLEYGMDGFNQGEPAAPVRLNYFLRLGIFMEGFVPAANTINSYSHNAQYAGGASWIVPFNFNNLANGDFKLSRYDQEVWNPGMESTYLPVGEQVKFIISKGNNSVEGLQMQHDLRGAAPGNAFHGKFLVNGNTSVASTMRLGLEVGVGLPDVDPDAFDPSWSWDYSGSEFGRVFYRVSGVGAVHCDIANPGMFNVSRSNYFHMRTNGSPNLSKRVMFSDGGPAPQVDLYIEARTNDPLEPARDKVGNEGTITCNINLTGALTWDNDLVVVARSTDSPATGPIDSAVAYLLAEKIVSGSVLNLELGWLKPGSYSVDVYKLGPTNSDQVERIGGAVSIVQLALPPQAFYEILSGERFYYQDEATATVSFDLAVAEGS